MLPPVRTVHVTAKEQLAAALAAADQVVVEGDDELLNYAVNKAADDPGNFVASGKLNGIVGADSVISTASVLRARPLA